MAGAPRLVPLFGATILLPGLVLAAFGVRALLQEGTLVEQQWQRRVDRAADDTAARLGLELQDWFAAAAALAGERPDASRLPEPLQRAVREPGVAAVRLETPGGIRTWPEDALAWRPWRPEPLSPRLADLGAAEALELEGGDVESAIARYQELLPSGRGNDRAWLLHRLARAFRKNGRTNDAERALDDLAALANAQVAGLPAGFLARYERLALDAGVAGDAAAAGAAALLDDLVAGRWILEEARYRYYADALRTRVAGHAALASRLAGIDRTRSAREALTEAAATSSPAPAPYVSLQGHDVSQPATHVAIVINRAWLIDHLTARGDAAAGGDLRATVRLADSDQTGPADGTSEGAAIRATRTVSAGGVSWKVDVEPQHPASILTDIDRRRRLVLGMAAGVVVLLGFGAYLTTRVVRREVEVARMKSDFVAAVSHEFRSPLTGIRQLSELLMRGRVPTEARRQEYYERITRESDRLSRIVENLLDFARMEEGRRAWDFQRVDTAAWLHDTVAAFQAQDACGSHRVEVAIADALPAVRIDREALTTAVGNLLSNAVKYSPGAGAVWFEASARNGVVVIEVRDRGIGIPRTAQPHVFDRFYRARQPDGARVTGTGLGLSLVHQIVKAHGGTVALDSEPGVGTTVSLHLKADA